MQFEWNKHICESLWNAREKAQRQGWEKGRKKVAKENSKRFPFRPGAAFHTHEINPN
jgi:hypothetical protein